MNRKIDQNESRRKRRKRSGPFWTLNLLSSAAIATATIMYPVDVLRALKMANESLSSFVQSHGIRGFSSKALQLKSVELR